MLLNACKDIGLAAITGKTKYMEIGRHRGKIANVHMKIGKKLQILEIVRLFMDQSKLYSRGNKIEVFSERIDFSLLYR